jgi:glycine cleavage system H protein
MPASGKILEVNDDLLANLEGLSDDPYDEGWLIKIELSNAADDMDKLLDAETYEAFISDLDG